MQCGPCFRHSELCGRFHCLRRAATSSLSARRSSTTWCEKGTPGQERVARPGRTRRVVVQKVAAPLPLPLADSESHEEAALLAVHAPADVAEDAVGGPLLEAPPLLAIEDAGPDMRVPVPAGQAKRRCVLPRIAGEIPAWVPGEFTPSDPILDGSKRLARVWADGYGGQCCRRPLNGQVLCKAHRTEPVTWEGD